MCDHMEICKKEIAIIIDKYMDISVIGMFAVVVRYLDNVKKNVL